MASRRARQGVPQDITRGRVPRQWAAARPRKARRDNDRWGRIDYSRVCARITRRTSHVPNVPSLRIMNPPPPASPMLRRGLHLAEHEAPLPSTLVRGALPLAPHFARAWMGARVSGYHSAAYHPPHLESVPLEEATAPGQG